ncbi:CZB domain-containing protein [Photobacterium proteolyticum]|uniref:CZB domain-containing protein n=1 Tax=Photobacterium proteolyticum TaxID=1903952 RepID=UPI003CCC0892
MVWKANVYRRIHNRELANTDVDNHYTCRLGCWYYHGRGKELFSGCRSYHQLEKPHADVHTYGRKVLEAFAEGNENEAMQLIAKMESAAETVTALLNNLLCEIAQVKQQ